MNYRLVRSNFAYFSLILAGVRPCGRVAPVTFPDSSTAEQSTVNRQVLGSNPSQGATVLIFIWLTERLHEILRHGI